MAALIPGRRKLLDLVSRAPDGVRQQILGTAYALMPSRVAGLLPVALVTLRDLPRIRHALVPPRERAAGPGGVCGLAGQAGVPELVEGYARGMHLFAHNGWLKWWSPPQRMTLFFDEARIEKTTRRLLRSGRFRITFDAAFAEVMRGCAAPRPGATPLTWITPRVQKLFAEAHRAGHAHSVEVWAGDELVGGLFGIACGRVFFTESQFHTARDASKVGFAVLNRHLQAWGFALNDGKHATPYLTASGFAEVPRRDFNALMDAYARKPAEADWRVDPKLLDDRWEPSQAAGVTRTEACAAIGLSASG
jgi:leucyl/phenylalanyl-tRNA--protein transferase